MSLFVNYNYHVLRHKLLGEAFTVKGGNLAEHIFVKYPKYIYT